MGPRFVRGGLGLGLLSIVVTGPLALLVGQGAGGTIADPVRTENARRGTSRWMVVDAPAGAIEGYTSQVSVAPGDRVELHVSTDRSARYRVEIYRLGWYGGEGGRLILCRPGCGLDEAGSAQSIPPFDPATGYVDAHWPVTDSIRVGDDWVSGYYVANLVLANGAYAGRGSSVPFVVRASAKAAAAAILVQASVNTWQAYNDWGGMSLYHGPTGASCWPACTHVSFNRPYTNSAQGLLQYELPLVHFLEKRGYDVSYTTDVDVDRDPDELLRHRLVIVAGHGEYWTKTIRDAYETARRAGTNLAFIGANIGYKQIHYADGRRTIVWYKTYSLDPEPDYALKAVRFRALIPPRPECELLGVQYTKDDAAGVESIGGPLDYTVNPDTLSDPWFARTGFESGSMLPGLVGYEWDAVTPGCGTPPLTIFFQYRGDAANADAVRYTAPSGARVFSGGSLRFSWGLDDLPASDGSGVRGDPRLQRFMENGLRDLLRPAPPAVVHVTVRPNGTVVTVNTRVDPRVIDTRIFRIPPSGHVQIGSSRAAPVCLTQGKICVDNAAPRHRRFRYAAVVDDRWGTSAPTLSQIIMR